MDAVIQQMAELYDLFTRADLPLAPECEEAERQFQALLIEYYDQLPPGKPAFRVIQRGVVEKCRSFLRAERKNPSV